MAAGPGWRQFERGNDDVKKAEILRIPLDKIKRRKGFNPRDMNKPSTQEKIGNMKESYLLGNFVPPLIVKLADGGEHVEIVDGECRFTAAEAANKAGGQVVSLLCIPFTGNDADEIVLTVNANEGEKLTPIELSVAVKKLINLGWDRPKIAKELNYSLSWVDQLVFMGTMPEKVKSMVNEGAVAPDVAAKVVKEEGSKAAETLASMVEENGGARVTAKHLKKRKAEAEPKERGQTKAPDPKQGAETATEQPAAPSKAAKKGKGKADWPFPDTAASLEVKNALADIAAGRVVSNHKKIKDDALYTIEVEGRVLKAIQTINKGAKK